MLTAPPTLRDIEAAAVRIAPHTHRTPVLTSTYLDQMLGAHLYFKCENFQKTGSFKMRGAANAVFMLGADEAARGVATHSSGNHAQALARAAQSRGIPAYLVMPRNAPEIKKRGVRGFGGQIIECEPTLEARETGLAEVVARTGANFVPPYDDYRIIAGQATCAYELLADAPPLDYLIAPVGGGGLLSGTALAAHYLAPGTQVWGAEPLEVNDAWQSLRQGKLVPLTGGHTIADGLRTSLSDKTFGIIAQHVHGVATVSEVAIIKAMRLVWEVLKIIIEPSCAVPLAALLEDQLENYQGKHVGLVLTGGNVDLDKLPWQ